MANSAKQKWMTEEALLQMHNQQRQDNLAAESMRMDRKAQRRDLERRLHMERVEAEMEEKVTQKRDGALVAKEDMEAKLNMEIMKLKSEEMNDLKLRQNLWENSPELKELRSKLRGAYIGKQIIAQIDEKKAASLQEKLDHKKVEDFMESKLALAKQRESRELEVVEAKKLSYKEDLLNQIAQSSKKQDAYREFLRDKEMLDFTLKAIKEEKRREEEMQSQRLKQFKEDVEKSKRLQEDYMQQKKQASEEEDRRIKNYLEERDKKEKEAMEKGKENTNLKKMQQEKLYTILSSHFGTSYEKDEKEEILHYLGEEELREKDLKRERDDMEKSLRWREELQTSEKRQQQEKKKTIEEESALQLAYRKQLEAENAKDGNLVQMELEKKRLTILEYRKQLQEQLEDKHRRQMEQWQRETALENLNRAEENQRRELVEEERVQMLKKHAPKLLGYLPTGVLREDDSACLGSDFAEVLNKFKAINSL